MRTLAVLILLQSLLVKSQVLPDFETIVLKQLDTFENPECSGFAVYHNELWVANDGIGIYMSADSGKSFKAMNKGLREVLVTAICTFRNELYCATKFKGLYLFNRKNKEWQRLSKGLSDSTYWSLAANDEYIFTSSGDEGLYKSKDGRTWERLKVKVRTETVADSGEVITGKTILYARNKILYAAALKKLYRSQTNGERWTEVKAPQNAGLGYISGVAENDTVLVISFFPGGIFATRNQGITWTRLADTDALKWPWSLYLNEGELWACSIFRITGGAYQLEGNYFEKVLPIKWANYIYKFGGYYYVGSSKGLIYKFRK